VTICRIVGCGTKPKFTGVNDPDVDPRKLRWRYEPAYPERKLIGAMPGGRRSWEKWYAQEVEFDEELGRSGYMEKLKKGP